MAIWAYGLEVHIGTPPQPIRVLLDIEMDTFHVQSVRCHTSICEDNNQTTFNSSASNTFNSLDNFTRLSYAAARVEGYLSEDTLNIGGLQIASQRFVDATYIGPLGFLHFYSGFNGALGFAPGHVNRRPYAPSPWETIVANHLLNQNIFSIVLPKGRRDIDSYKPRTNGEFLIGDVPEGWSEESAITLPLKWSSYAYATSLESLQFGTSYESFAGKEGTAYFFTTWPFITLPLRWIEMIAKQVPRVEPRRIFVPCHNRTELPDFTFGIGGKNITLTPLQYTFEEIFNGTVVCSMSLLREDDEDTIGLGWPFLENFGVVFDVDHNEVKLNYQNKYQPE